MGTKHAIAPNRAGKIRARGGSNRARRIDAQLRKAEESALEVTVRGKAVSEYSAQEWDRMVNRAIGGV